MSCEAESADVTFESLRVGNDIWVEDCRGQFGWKKDISPLRCAFAIPLECACNRLPRF